MSAEHGDPGRYTVAPWFHCDMAERHGLPPVGRAVLRGGVAFCPYCGGTRVTHREVHMMDGRVAWIDAAPIGAVTA